MICLKSTKRLNVKSFKRYTCNTIKSLSIFKEEIYITNLRYMFMKKLLIHSFTEVKINYHTFLKYKNICLPNITN